MNWRREGPDVSQQAQVGKWPLRERNVMMLPLLPCAARADNVTRFKTAPLI
jgi:hypothetical protein